MKTRRNRKAPLSGGTDQQRKNITRIQFNTFLHVMQAWGYDRWDMENFVRAMDIAIGVEASTNAG